ncbi:hypothetical protein Sste5346_004676 [Sporothrix stenoceras]|uniref:Uncharacterized protein n=1 Tax=Sporothrix stenoceras TaxID=5173 RepID=A0ABR3Z8Z5_9PEZI
METETDDRPVHKCSSHRHIRECFTAEMDRYMADREMRFLSGDLSPTTLTIEEDPFQCLRRIGTVTEAEPHDPRIRTMVEHFMTARMSIPLGMDRDGLPTFYPATPSTSESLDAIEAARFAMAHNALASRRAERSRIAVQKVVTLAFATMVYVKAVQRLHDLDGGRLGESRLGRPSVDGLISAYDTEKRVLLLARHLISTHQKDKQRAATIAGAVAERLRRCRDVLTDDVREQAAVNEDDLTAAAIASHAKCLHVAMARECLQNLRAEREAVEGAENTERATGPAAALLVELRAASPRVSPRASPSHSTRQKSLVLQSSQQQQQQAYAAAKADAVVKYTAAERALQAMKTECRAQGRRVPNIHFHIYPVRDRGRDTISFHVDQRMYVTVQREPTKKR